MKKLIFLTFLMMASSAFAHGDEKHEPMAMKEKKVEIKKKKIR